MSKKEISSGTQKAEALARNGNEKKTAKTAENKKKPVKTTVKSEKTVKNTTKKTAKKARPAKK